MSYTYAQKKRPDFAGRHKEAEKHTPTPDALRTGAVQPTAAQLGRRVDLPDAMRTKMERAFGTDLSAVRLYESPAVADAGAKAVSQGTKIAFAPGLLDYSSADGQALLGHELSHVVSQARGEVRGNGFLNDPALEARADREGALAAAGKTVAAPTASLTSVTAASATGPMQAALSKKDKSTQNHSWEFTSAPGEEQFQAENVGAQLGMQNAGQGDQPTTHEAAFRTMMQGVKSFTEANKYRDSRGGRAAYDAMRGNTYGEVISGMKGYKHQLKAEEAAEKQSKNWFHRHFRRSAESKERDRQLKLLSGYIAGAKSDRDRNLARAHTTITPAEYSGSGGKGGISEVPIFSRGSGAEKANAFYKAYGPGAKKTETSKVVEHYATSRAGIRDQDAQGKHIDAHLANREIAYSRLSSLLGSTVGVGAKRATFVPGNKKGAPSEGVLTEEGKGQSWRNYNWRYFGPEGPLPNDLSQDPMNAVYGGSRDDNWGNRLDAQGTKLERKDTKNVDAFKGKGEMLDAADPDFQRQMNEMFLLDTLSNHMDRHEDNFHVNRDAQGKISVKAIDNDTTFGTYGSKAADEAAFGKRGDQGANYGGLPAKMQIDANMAAKIKEMTPETLKKTFSDLLSPKEIDALGTRFDQMKQYIQKLEQDNPDLLVKEWNDETAMKELRLAGGVSSYANEDSSAPGEFAGNNYYQRQMLTLRAIPTNAKPFIAMAEGGTNAPPPEIQRALSIAMKMDNGMTREDAERSVKEELKRQDDEDEDIESLGADLAI